MSDSAALWNRLGTKLIVLILICSLVPLGVSTYISVSKAQGALEQSTHETMGSEVSGVAQNAETRSAFYKSQVDIVRSHPSVHALAEYRYGNETLDKRADRYERGTAYPKMLAGTDEYQRTLRFFDGVAAKNPNIDMIRVFWRDGNVLAGHKLGHADTSDYKADKAWFKRVMNEQATGDDEVYVSAINIARATDSPAIRYAMPIQVDGERVGLVIINYQAKQITAPVTGLDLGADGYGMLVDPNYTNAEGEGIGAAYVANGRNPSLAFNTSVAGDLAIPSDDLEGANGSFTFSNAGRTWDASYERVQIAGGRTYYAVAAEPRSQVLATAHSIRNMGLSVSALSGLVAIGLGLFVTRRLVTGPIERLTEDAEAVADGDMDRDIRASEASSEMTRLTRSTSQMKDNVLDALSEAESQREEVERRRQEARDAKEQAEELSNHLEAQAQAYESVMRACADGDLTRRMDPESQSKAMTEIAEAFNAMMDDIESTIQEIQAFADEVSAASEETSAGAGEIKQASQEVSRSIQGISSGTGEQREMLETVSEEMNDLSATIEEVASSAQTVADTSRETTEIADAGETTAQEAIEASRAVQDAIGSTVTHVEDLDEQMNEIGEIVELIGDIAEQTNMLALNANIEAARAGEEGSASGDGFAVVADEVKQLAEETRESAAKIGQLIEETQAQTSATVEEVRTAAEHMEEGSEAVQEVVDAFTRVAENMGETDSGIQEISEATDSQAASAEEAVAMIDDVADVSQSTADEAESVSAAAEEQASSISQISTSVESLAEQAEKLQTLLAKFEVEATRTQTDAEAASRAGVALEDGGQEG